MRIFSTLQQDLSPVVAVVSTLLIGLTLLLMLAALLRGQTRMTQPFLSIRGLEKTYGKLAAVENVSLDIAEGEFITLLGPCKLVSLLVAAVTGISDGVPARPSDPVSVPKIGTHRACRLRVTHDQEEALRLSDKIALFYAGRIEQVGTGRDLYEAPAPRFVAGFIGNSNFLDGDLLARPDHQIARRNDDHGYRPRQGPAAARAGVDHDPA